MRFERHVFALDLGPVDFIPEFLQGQNARPPVFEGRCNAASFRIRLSSGPLLHGQVHGGLASGFPGRRVSGFVEPVEHVGAGFSLVDAHDLKAGDALLGPARNRAVEVLSDLPVSLFAFQQGRTFHANGDFSGQVRRRAFLGHAQGFAGNRRVHGASDADVVRPGNRSLTHPLRRRGALGVPSTGAPGQQQCRTHNKKGKAAAHLTCRARNCSMSRQPRWWASEMTWARRAEMEAKSRRAPSRAFMRDLPLRLTSPLARAG